MSSLGANPGIFVLTNFIISNIHCGNIFKSRVNDKQNYYEKQILDVWAKKYVRSFFQPTVRSNHPVKLESFVVQNQTDTNNNNLYKIATKFDFHNENLMSRKNLAAFQLEMSLLHKSNNKTVNSKLQKSILQKFLSQPRHDENSEYFRNTASYLTMKLGRMGLFILNHNFQFDHKGMAGETVDGLNIVGVLPGVRWGSDMDKVVMVTAHYDTVATSPGVDDNGSGVVALLEAARVLSSSSRKDVLNTVIFALFDKEEVGCEGSQAFVRDFIVPVLIHQFGSKVQGVYNLDSISSFSEEVNSQDVEESWVDIDSGMVHKIVENKRRGDFILTVGRNNPDDTLLALTLMKHLKGYASHHMKIEDFTNKLPSPELLENRIFALRTDIARFWFYREIIAAGEVVSQYSFPGVTVTDTSYLRHKMRQCYHAECDSIITLTQDNLRFLSSISQAITDAVIELSTEQEIYEPSGHTNQDNDDDDDKDDTEIKKPKNVAKKHSKKDLATAQRISHYENVETQINIENLYLTLEREEELTSNRIDEDNSFLYLNPKYNQISKIISSYYKPNGTHSNSPMVLKLKTDL